MMGGMGCCGRPLCCATFLGDFVPVSIRMAKEQNLSLNPTKISGICGRLMCCLKYESEGYGCGGCMKTQKAEYTPAQNDRVAGEEGEGRIVALNEQRRTATILMDDGKTVVSGWDDITPAESDGCPHVQREARPHTPREGRALRDQREGRERRERSDGQKSRRDRREGAAQGEKGDRPRGKGGSASRRSNGGKRPRRAPRAQQPEEVHE